MCLSSCVWFYRLTITEKKRREEKNRKYAHNEKTNNYDD